MPHADSASPRTASARQTAKPNQSQMPSHRLAEVSGQRKLMDPSLPRVAEVIARVTGVSYHPGHSPACIGCDAQVASRPVSAKSLFFAREGD
jgi:hypothetical protein